MLAHLHHELTLNDDIQLLPRVGSQLNILVLRLLGVGGAHEQRLGDTVLEGVGHVVVHHAVSLGDLLPRPCAGDGVGLQLGAVAFNNFGDVDVERQGATVDEGEVEVALAALATKVFLGGDARLGGHLGGLQSLDLAEGTDTSRHLLDLEIQSGHGGGLNCLGRLIHVFIPFSGADLSVKKQAHPSQSVMTLRRVRINSLYSTRGTTQIAERSATLPGRKTR